MNERLNGYLEDLDARLRPHFEDARRAEVIAELRAHLTMSSRDAQEQLAMGSDEATRAALRSLGPVEVVAEDLVRQHRGGTAKSNWEVLRTAVWLYILAFLVLPLLCAIVPVEVLMSPWLQTPLLYLPTVFLIAFGLAVWKSRRWLMKPMLACIGGMTLIHLLLTMTPIAAYLQSLPQGGYVKVRQEQLRQIDAELELVRQGAAGYLRRDPAFAKDGAFLVPQETPRSFAVMIPFTPYHYVIGDASTVTLFSRPWSPEGVQRWRELGSRYDSILEADRSRLESFPGPIPNYPWAIYLVALPMLQGATLGLVNLALLAASDRRRKRRGRRDPHLA